MTIPPGDRRFYLAAGVVMLAGRFGPGEGHRWVSKDTFERGDIFVRVATEDDLARLTAFGRRVLASGDHWDVSSFQWWARRSLTRSAA